MPYNKGQASFFRRVAKCGDLPAILTLDELCGRVAKAIASIILDCLVISVGSYSWNGFLHM